MSKLRILCFVFIVTAGFIFLFGCSLSGVDADGVNTTGARTISSAKSDSLTYFNSGMWNKADWNNGSPFGCAWNPNNISFSGNGMAITLNNTARNGRSYSGGEYRSNDTFTYGTFSVSMSTFTQSGTVQSFFLYTGSPWDEIDVEKIGNKGWQYNYYKNGQGGHEFMGNGSTTITWAPNYITYGGRTINGSSSSLPSHNMQVMMNVWNHDGSANDWLGSWNYSGARTTTYRNFNYSPLSGGGGGGSGGGSGGGGGGNPTPITPYLQVNDGSWQQTSSVTVNSGAKVKFGPQPVSGGSWSWSGGGTSGSSREQTIYPSSSCTATATYTNSSGAKSTQTFNVTVNGSGGGSGGSGGGSGGGGTAGNFELQAWNCSSSSGVTIWNGGVGSFDPGDWIRFNNVNLSSGYNNFSIEYATTISGSMEVRLDSAWGTVIGTVNYSSTGGWGTYKWTGCGLNPGVANGRHTIYVKSTNGAANLARITFNNY
jgi:endo-1,3-1,4-beta-glycanase ExoK